MTIMWKGLLESKTGLAMDVRAHVHTFLKQANLVCEGMSIVGYDQAENSRDAWIDILAHPSHCNHIDLSVVPVDRVNGLKVRVMWNRLGVFPVDMGIPTVKRVQKAVAEFNETGSVQTTADDTPTVPSYAASIVLRMQAIHQRFSRRH